MPVSTSSSSLPASSSTFTSVFGGEADNARLKGPSSTLSSRPPSRSHQSHNQRSAHSSNPSSASRRGSLKSESAESSPTTTISTVDSSLTEPSPSSSPESPTGLVPLASFTSLSKSTNSSSSKSGMDHALPGLPAPSNLGFEQAESPNKKGRNVRNLFINTNGISTTRPATAPALKGPPTENSTTSLPTTSQGNGITAAAGRLPFGPGVAANSTVTGHPFSEPVSPAFIMPNLPRPRKSKMSLTLTTSDSSGSSSGGVPATPAFAPPPKTPGFGLGFTKMAPTSENEQTLFSPCAAPNGGMKLPPMGRNVDPSLPTPSQGPEGGMSLPPFGGYPDCSPQRPTSRPALSIGQRNFEGGPGSSVINQTIEHSSQIPLHDLPLSREVKSPSYPSGPICIYPPSVFLYHQPTCAEAREFDVIINVAREVTNPFELEKEEEITKKAERGYTDSGVQCELLSGPPLSLAFKDAPSVPHDDEPATPKASTPKVSRDPEYIHLPWEHNSNVYLEWLDVCEKIDSRVKEGKKVLIHCQLGVSRSASLIVAYGLYKNPSLSPDEAREQAKEKSRWIDLNMHFMYELGDFKKILGEKFGEQYATRRPAGPAPLQRSRTDNFFATGHANEDIPRRASSGNTQATPESIEEEPAGIMSAFPSTSTLPFGRDAAPLPPMPSKQMTLPFRPAEIQPPIQESDSSDATTPIRSEPIRERAIPQRTKTSDSDKTLKPNERDSPQAHPLPPPLPTEARLQPLHSESTILDANATPAKPTQPFATIANDSPHIPEPTPPRRLRPMPSLPAGFSSIRRVSPGLSLNTNTPSPSLSLLKSPDAPQSMFNRQPNTQERPTAGNAPSLPPLDLGNSVLMSPRTTEFAMGSFHRSRGSLAGDLAGADFLMSPGAQERDPRSPPIRGEAPVTRSIDDVL